MLGENLVRRCVAGSLAALTISCAAPGLHRADRSSAVLTQIIAELQLHLRDDPYRYDRSRSPGGRNVFADLLWRLDRLRRERGASGPPDNASLVIEFARARALERLHRYAEARDAYSTVASAGSLLAAPAEAAAVVMDLFARSSVDPADDARSGPSRLAFLDERVRTWTQIAWRQRDSVWGPLALEESEAWSMRRVEAYSRERGPEAAIEPALRLVESHRASKLYSSHLIRLGDLYARAARHQALQLGAGPQGFDSARYEKLLDHAFVAYELAADAPHPAARSEAEGKIEALLAYHSGVRNRAP
ncbi:MAG: hypothetical protein ACE5IL_03890 [Myxococcota bacterium]